LKQDKPNQWSYDFDYLAVASAIEASVGAFRTPDIEHGISGHFPPISAF